MITRRGRPIPLALALFFGLMLSTTSPALAITIYTDSTAFVAATGAVNIPVPNAGTAFPCTDCGSPYGQTGAGSTVVMPFGSNSAAIMNASGGSLALCIFDAGAVITNFTSGTTILNTNPSTMIANTIVGNGEEDYVLTFTRPVTGGK